MSAEFVVVALAVASTLVPLMPIAYRATESARRYRMRVSEQEEELDVSLGGVALSEGRAREFAELLRRPGSVISVDRTEGSEHSFLANRQIPREISVRMTLLRDGRRFDLVLSPRFSAARGREIARILNESERVVDVRRGPDDVPASVDGTA